MRPVFNQCCCCFSLETGGQIIGWFYAVAGVLSTIGCIGLAYVFGGNEDPQLDDARTVLVTIFVILACFAFINIIAGILLIVGVRQRKHNKMIFMLLLMILGIISSFMNFIYSATATDIVSVIIGVFIQIYFFVCVLSLYNKVKEENRITPKEHQPA
ncbi:unnamed protein product [Chironomus riparius]|uniref:Uncharacterized protein n=1 Tax=Chironomus riparius TaxID=315576 RepID=A0A9N9RIP6_9DIPT|nr:unnamed protein product [Chironomus riparius]